VNYVCESPGHRDGQERQTEEDIMNERYNDDVRHPHAFTVEISRIRVRIAVRNSHVHF